MKCEKKIAATSRPLRSRRLVGSSDLNRWNLCSSLSEIFCCQNFFTIRDSKKNLRRVIRRLISASIIINQFFSVKLINYNRTVDSSRNSLIGRKFFDVKGKSNKNKEGKFFSEKWEREPNNFKIIKRISEILRKFGLNYKKNSFLHKITHFFQIPSEMFRSHAIRPSAATPIFPNRNGPISVSIDIDPPPHRSDRSTSVASTVSSFDREPLRSRAATSSTFSRPFQKYTSRRRVDKKRYRGVSEEHLLGETDSIVTHCQSNRKSSPNYRSTFDEYRPIINYEMTKEIAGPGVETVFKNGGKKSIGNQSRKSIILGPPSCDDVLDELHIMETTLKRYDLGK